MFRGLLVPGSILLVLSPSAQADIPALMGELASLRAELIAAGLDASRETSTLFTAAYYQAAISSDANNSDLPAVFSAWMQCGSVNTSCNELATQEALELPGLETSELEGALLSAIAEASRVITSPQTRLPSPWFNATQLVLDAGYWRDASGAPRFATGFNQMNTASITNGSQQAYSIGFNDFSVGISWCLLSNGSIPTSVVESLQTALVDAQNGGYKVEIFVDHSRPPAWALQLWPDIANCTNKYVGYDIDNPHIIAMEAQMLNGVARAILAMPGQLVGAVASWNLHNEPYFQNATSPWSAASYASWLNSSYAGNLSELNAGWGTSFSSFSDIGWLDLQVSGIFYASFASRRFLKATMACPCVQGYHRFWNLPVAERFDWSEWNRARATSWFTGMRTAITAALPGAACHVKLINEQSYWQLQPHNIGIDKESLADAMDISGCDTRVPTPPRNDPVAGHFKLCIPPPPSFAPAPGISWVEPCMAYDLQRSLAPSKAIFDSEWHLVSDDAFYVPNITSGHAYAGTMLAAFSGLSGSITWYWARSSGSAKAPSSHSDSATWFPYSLQTQPQLADALARAHFDLNALSPVVPPLVSSRRQIRLLFSEASATQDPGNYSCVQVAAYEALANIGVPVGFVTDVTLGSPAGCLASLFTAPSIPAPGLLVIPATSYVSDAATDCVRAYAAAGGGLAVVGASTASGGEALRYTPRGTARSNNAIAWLDDAPHITLDAPASMFQALEAAALPFVQRDAVCTDPSAGGTTALGVWCRYTACSASGELSHDGPLPAWLLPPALPACRFLIFLVNARAAAANVSISVLGIVVPSALSLLTNSSVDIGAAGIAVPALGVRFLLV